MKQIFLSAVFLIIPFLVSAQVSKDSLMKKYIVEVKDKVAGEDYKGAEQSLLKAFALNTVLPDEAAFYYGLIQIRLKNYVKGKEGLQKYILLTEGAGEFHNQTVALLEEANSNICKKCNNTGISEKRDTCSVCKGIGSSEEACNQCKHNGQEICSTCHGKGVVVYKTSLSTSYQECFSCNGKGIVSCNVCDGTKKKKVYCTNCKGIGFFKRKVSCDHVSE